MREKTKMWSIAFGVLFAFLVIISANAQAGVNIQHGKYTTERGTTLDVTASITTGGLNTTDFIEHWYYFNATDVRQSFSNANIEDIEDFSTATYTTLTDDYAFVMNGDLFWFETDTIDDFDGVWVKKSAGASIDAITVGNDTVGEDSIGVLLVDDETLMYFSENSNTSYKYVYGILADDDFGEPNIYSVSEYVNYWGSIDNITVYWTTSGGREINLYEFHLFSDAAYITDYRVETQQNITMAWNIDVTYLTNNTVLFSIEIPSNANLGNYYFIVEMSNGNYDYAVIEVTTSEYSIFTWAWCIIPIFIGLGLIGIADFIMDTKTNPVAVVIVTAVGVVFIAVGTMIGLDLLGWTNFGLLG